jgi:hypothetical protein
LLVVSFFFEKVKCDSINPVAQQDRWQQIQLQSGVQTLPNLNTQTHT